MAWALGDLFERAELPELAALCRAADTHEALSVWPWMQSFEDVPAGFWRPALDALRRRPRVPPRAGLSLASAHALLDVVADGLRLTREGQLPHSTVLALDDRFGWTQEFPWMRATAESEVAPLHLLHEHLLRQRLLRLDGTWLARTPLGVACAGDPGRLWQAVVEPSPRWSGEFERDALGVMAAAVLRSADFTLGRVADQMTRLLAGKWRPVGDGHGTVFDGAALVARTWYQLGVPLGWWDTGRGPADRVPNEFGRMAAATVFRAVATGSSVVPAR